MPAQERVRRHKRGDLGERRSTERLRLLAQTPALVIREWDALAREALLALFQLGVLKLDDLLLVLVDPAGIETSRICQGWMATAAPKSLFLGQRRLAVEHLVGENPVNLDLRKWLPDSDFRFGGVNVPIRVAAAST